MKILNEKLNKIFPVIFIALCFLLIITRVPFFDEAHAYLLSKFSLFELWQVTRIEGHPLIWFLILKLINGFNFYPYPMLFLTFLISLVLIIFFWRKAPFEPVFKVLILSSFPFLGYFLVVARPYGLTILFLFLTAYYFKKQKIILFSLFLAILANVTIMGAIGATSFLILFIKKIFQEKIDKKDLIISILIILFGFLFLFLQLYNPQIPDKINEISESVKNGLFYYFIFPFKDFLQKNLFQNIFELFSFILFYLSLVIIYKKDKNSFIFLISSFLLLTFLLLNIYSGAIWHYFFYFIFFIVSLWLCWEKLEKLKTYKIFVAIFLILTTSPIFYSGNGIDVLNNAKKYKPVLNRIIKDEKLKKAKLFCFEKNSYVAPALVPYLKQNKINLYDINGFERGSFESYIKTYFKKDKCNIDSFVSNLDKNSYLFVNNLSNTNIPPIIVLKGEKYNLTLKLVDKIEESIFAIYKIEAKIID